MIVNKELPTYNDLAKETWEEALHLSAIVSGRYEKEPEIIRQTRADYAYRFNDLLNMKDDIGWCFAWKDVAMAITHLEDARIRHISALYYLINKNEKSWE